jgi:hypothetical protein
MGSRLVTISADACVLWQTSGNALSKQRSISSKDGNHFTQARFTADGQAIVTLFRDGDIVQWSLDEKHQIDSEIVNLNIKSTLFTCFEIGL